MGNIAMDWTQFSDAAIIRQIGSFIRQIRLQKNITQDQLATSAGLNRWTVSQIEKGESVTLSSLVQILRALDSLHVLSAFEVKEEISPLEYARLKKHKKERARSKKGSDQDKNDPGW